MVSHTDATIVANDTDPGHSMTCLLYKLLNKHDYYGQL